MPGYIVHPGFITMRLLCGGGERVTQVVKPKIGREMPMKGAFEKKKGNRQGGADFVDIRQKRGVQGDPAGFGVLPFFLFGGLNGNKDAFVGVGMRAAVSERELNKGAGGSFESARPLLAIERETRRLGKQKIVYEEGNLSVKSSAALRGVIKHGI